MKHLCTNIYVTECIVCVPGHVPLTLSILWSFLFFDWVGILWPNYLKRYFVVQRGDFTVAIVCVPCGPRRSLIYA